MSFISWSPPYPNNLHRAQNIVGLQKKSLEQNDMSNFLCCPRKKEKYYNSSLNEQMLLEYLLWVDFMLSPV